jgi:phosphoglycolate phosphatase
MSDKWLVLFDIDGTLLHSGGCGRAATRLAMQDVFGTRGTVDNVPFAGMTDLQILIEALTPAGFSPEQVQTKLDEYNTTVARHLCQIIGEFPVRPCVGVPEIVTALRENPAVIMGLVTGNIHGLVPIKLQAAGYDPADFKIGAFGSEGVNRSMLPPLALERARAYSNANFSPEQIVIIGDTPRDIECAASIQARTIAVATGPFSVTDLRAYRPDHVFETLADRDAVLSAIFPNGHIG